MITMFYVLRNCKSLLKTLVIIYINYAHQFLMLKFTTKEIICCNSFKKCII